MPWSIRQMDGKYCVVKKGESKPVPGGCHDTRAKAVKHQRALYASESVSSEAITPSEYLTMARIPEAVTMNMQTGTTAGTGTFEVTANMTSELMELKDTEGNVIGFTFPSALRVMEGTGEEMAEVTDREWEGVLGIVGYPTSDGRYLIPNEIGERDFPLPFNVCVKTDEGHKGSDNAGRIEEILYVPAGEFDRHEFPLPNVPDEAIVIWGRGILDDSPAADEAERLITNGAGVSLDLPPDRFALIDRETFEEIAEEDADMADVLSGKYLTGVGGKIAGATVVTIPAFEEAAVRLTEESVLVASAYGMRVVKELPAEAFRVGDTPLPDHTVVLSELAANPPSDDEIQRGAEGVVLLASAAPLKPPREWFNDPGLQKLTPLTITKEGRIFGHLCDWSGCHTGFGSVCVPPFRSPSNYAYFNTGLIETVEGEDVPCGKLMFSREGGKHADTNPRLSAQDVSKHYDDSTKVGGYVRAGEDRHGTWLAGCVRHDLNDIELQHLKSHPPSGDWRPIPNKGTELVAAFSVPVPGFPIPHALVASGADGELVIITAPLDMELGPRQAIRQRQMMRSRLRAALTR